MTCANTARTSTQEDTQNYSKDSPEFKTTVVTMHQSNHTHSALEEAARVRLSHIQHTKGRGETSGLDRIFAELAYEATSVSLNRDRTLPPASTTAYTEPSSTRRSSALYSPAPKPPLEMPSRARHQTDMPATVLSRNSLTQLLNPIPSPTHHREIMPTPKT
jgi:hypothetical protein